MVFLRRPPAIASLSPSVRRRRAPSFLGDVGAGFLAHQPVVAARQIAFRRVGKGVVQVLGDGKAQHPVAEEFQALVIGEALLAERDAGMGERLMQKVRSEPVADQFLQLLDVRDGCTTSAFSGSVRRSASSGSRKASAKARTSLRSRRSRRR